MYIITCLVPTKFYEYKFNGETRRLPSSKHIRLFKRKFTSLEEVVKYTAENEYICFPRLDLELSPKDCHSFIQKYRSYRNKKS